MATYKTYGRERLKLPLYRLVDLGLLLEPVLGYHWERLESFSQCTQFDAGPLVVTRLIGGKPDRWLTEVLNAEDLPDLRFQFIGEERALNYHDDVVAVVDQTLRAGVIDSISSAAFSDNFEERT